MRGLLRNLNEYKSSMVILRGFDDMITFPSLMFIDLHSLNSNYSGTFLLSPPARRGGRDGSEDTSRSGKGTLSPCTLCRRVTLQDGSEDTSRSGKGTASPCTLC